MFLVATALSGWLYEEAGIEIPPDRLVFDIYENPRGHKSCEGRVYYQSYFSSGKRSIPKIKFDLTADEILVLPPSRQAVFHTYTDACGWRTTKSRGNWSLKKSVAVW